MVKPPYRPSARLYETFHGQPADAVEICRVPRIVPPVVVRLGSLGGMIYRSDKGSPGFERTYIHYMEDPPHLVCNPEGTQLYIVGGSYRITRRGIEG